MGIIFDKALESKTQGEYAKKITALGDAIEQRHRLKDAFKESQEAVYKMQGERQTLERSRKLE
jgi:hypothetical protein